MQDDISTSLPLREREFVVARRFVSPLGHRLISLSCDLEALTSRGLLGLEPQKFRICSKCVMHFCKFVCSVRNVVLTCVR